MTKRAKSIHYNHSYVLMTNLGLNPWSFNALLLRTDVFYLPRTITDEHGFGCYAPLTPPSHITAGLKTHGA